jgi:mannosyltransferase OCH1-like enzyme
MLRVPRIFHQIWLGPNPLPEEFARYQRTWLEHHPGWELRCWTDDNLPGDLRRREVYEPLRFPAERADILRLELLWRDGGVYLDTDMECLRCIEPIIDGLDFFTGYMKPDRVNNAFVGAVSGHPILDRAVHEVRPRNRYGLDKAAAGPLFLDRLVRDYPEVTIFEPAFFYPTTPAERTSAYAIHHVARSWKDEQGFEAARIRAEERIDKAERKLAKSQRQRALLEHRLAWIQRLLRPAAQADEVGT